MGGFTRKEAEMIENVLNANDKKFVFPEGGIHDRIIKGVLKGFGSKSGFGSNRAIEDFLDAYQNRLGKKEDKEILKEITSKEAVEAIIQFHQALF